VITFTTACSARFYLCNHQYRYMYYTTDHEWIDFQGSVAYVGVCDFKLTGFRDIDNIVFSDTGDFKRKGETIATITYNDFSITINMPTDGRLIRINESLLTKPQSTTLLKNAENSSGWVALISPSQPYERKGLLLSPQYKMNNKSKHAKS
jgi:glycine cleavage system H protein